jgi:2-C-methyl-D-erythritol 4-phosphate cytidylyltransferase
MNNIAIITAGGSGTRLPGKCKKQFLPLRGKPVIAYSLEAFLSHPEISAVVATIPQEDIDFARKLLNSYLDQGLTIIAGGKERQHSVLNALNIMPANTDYVFIHDAVRPLLTAQEIDSLLQNVIKQQAVIPAHKVKHTIKSVEGNRIVKTIPRDSLMEVYTPQVFEFSLILDCHKKAAADNLLFTDDAAILEHYGYQVFVSETSQLNIKITEPEDLPLVEYLLSKATQKQNN